MTDIWEEKPDTEQMITDVKWLSKAVIDRTPCQNVFRGLQIELTRMDAWLKKVKVETDEMHESYNELHEMAQEWGRTVETIKAILRQLKIDGFVTHHMNEIKELLGMQDSTETPQ